VPGHPRCGAFEHAAATIANSMPNHDAVRDRPERSFTDHAITRRTARRPTRKSVALVTSSLRSGDLRPVAESAEGRYHEKQAALGEGKGAVMAHVVVRIIELLLAIGLTAAVTAMFALAMISVVHGLHSAGRHR